MKVLFILIGMCCSGILIGQNLLKNGKFITGQAGWETLRSQNEAAVMEQSSAYRDYGLGDQFAGLSFVELDARSAIQQTIPTEKGQRYTLVYNYSHRPQAGDKQLIVLANGHPIHTEKIENRDEPGRFRPRSLSFSAEKEQTTLAFYVVSLSGDEAQGILVTDAYAGKEGEVDLNLYYSY